MIIDLTAEEIDVLRVGLYEYLRNGPGEEPAIIAAQLCDRLTDLGLTENDSIVRPPLRSV